MKINIKAALITLFIISLVVAIVFGCYWNIVVMGKIAIGSCICISIVEIYKLVKNIIENDTRRV